MVLNKVSGLDDMDINCIANALEQNLHTLEPQIGDATNTAEPGSKSKPEKQWLD
jgi:hypothetical protein